MAESKQREENVSSKELMIKNETKNVSLMELFWFQKRQYSTKVHCKECG